MSAAIREPLRPVRGFGFRGIHPSGLVAPVRAAVLEGLSRNLAANPGFLWFATENVLPLEGFACDMPGEPGEGLEVFACATIGIHSDEGLVARYSNLVNLGTVAGDEARHYLHASPRPGTPEAMREAVGRGEGDIGKTAMMTGEHYLLDGHCPHCLTVTWRGRELGDPLGDDPDPTVDAAWLEGVPRDAVTALFVAYTADVEITHAAFARVLASLRLV